jgi:hypothetical protein
MSRRKYRIKKKRLCDVQLKYYEPVFFYPNCVRFDSSVESLVGLRGMKFNIRCTKKREGYESRIWIEDPQNPGEAVLEEKFDCLSKPWSVFEADKFFSKEKVDDLQLSTEGLDCIVLYIKQDAWGFETKGDPGDHSKEYKSKAGPKDQVFDRMWKSPAVLHKYLVFLRTKFLDHKLPEKACLQFNGLKRPSFRTGVSFSNVVGEYFVEHAEKWARWRPKDSNAGFAKKSLESFSSTFAIHTSEMLFYTSSSSSGETVGGGKRLFWVSFEEGKSYVIADKLKGAVNIAEHDHRLTIVADELEISKVFVLDSRELSKLSKGHRIELATVVEEVSPLFPDINFKSFDLQTSFMRAICTGDRLFTFFCSSHMGHLVFKARVPDGYLSYSLPTAERLEFAKVGSIRKSLVLVTMMTRAQLLLMLVDCRRVRKTKVIAAQESRFSQIRIDKRKIYLLEIADLFDYRITRITLSF